MTWKATRYIQIRDDFKLVVEEKSTGRWGWKVLDEDDLVVTTDWLLLGTNKTAEAAMERAAHEADYFLGLRQKAKDLVDRAPGLPLTFSFVTNDKRV